MKDKPTLLVIKHYYDVIPTVTFAGLSARSCGFIAGHYGKEQRPDAHTFCNLNVWNLQKNIRRNHQLTLATAGRVRPALVVLKEAISVDILERRVSKRKLVLLNRQENRYAGPAAVPMLLLSKTSR